jgi:hypothetical protein
MTCFMETRSSSIQQCCVFRSLMEFSETIPKATNSKSRVADRMVTWPALWKLGQGAAQDSDVSRSPMEIS